MEQPPRLCSLGYSNRNIQKNVSIYFITFLVGLNDSSMFEYEYMVIEYDPMLLEMFILT